MFTPDTRVVRTPDGGAVVVDTETANAVAFLTREAAKMQAICICTWGDDDMPTRTPMGTAQQIEAYLRAKRKGTCGET